MLIGLGEATTPFDFGLTWFEVKFRRVTCKKMYTCFLLINYLENYFLCHGCDIKPLCDVSGQ